VLIPDAVFHEATAASGKLGALEIIDWYRAHTDKVRVEPTEIFQNEMTLRAIGRDPPTRDLWSGHDPEVRDAVRRIVEGGRERKG